MCRDAVPTCLGTCPTCTWSRLGFGGRGSDRERAPRRTAGTDHSLHRSDREDPLPTPHASHETYCLRDGDVGTPDPGAVPQHDRGRPGLVGLRPVGFPRSPDGRLRLPMRTTPRILLATLAALGTLTAPVALQPASAAAWHVPGFVRTIAGPGEAGVYAWGMEYNPVTDEMLVGDYWNYQIRRY